MAYGDVRCRAQQRHSVKNAPIRVLLRPINAMTETHTYDMTGNYSVIKSLL